MCERIRLNPIQGLGRRDEGARQKVGEKHLFRVLGLGFWGQETSKISRDFAMCVLEFLNSNFGYRVQGLEFRI